MKRFGLPTLKPRRPLTALSSNNGSPSTTNTTSSSTRRTHSSSLSSSTSPLLSTNLASTNKPFGPEPQKRYYVQWPSSSSSTNAPRLIETPLYFLKGGPRLLLRVPVSAARKVRGAGGKYVLGGGKRLFSTGLRRGRMAQQGTNGSGQEGRNGAGAGAKGGIGGQESFTSRLKKRWQSTPIQWAPIPISLGAAVLVVLTFYKSQKDGLYPSSQPVPESSIKVQGPWQVHVIGALPLRSISRIYGYLNSYTLPVWFRTPGYKLYAWFFGVNLQECEPSDLREYRSMSEFFMRRLKDGVRPIADAQLVSPADGRVVNFGLVQGGRVEQVKGSTYSLEALLQGTGPVDPNDTTKSSRKPKKPYVAPEHPHKAAPVSVNEEEFANVNGIPYSLEELVGNRPTGPGSSPSFTTEDASVSTPGNLKRTFSSDAKVAMEINRDNLSSPKKGHQLFFTVIYLAPGDYHRYHSPTNWVVEKRRHFAGELFSVSPWMASKLQDLFVLNERVALLGKWRYGFFSMTPVGATNVGSIRVNFDSTLRTNSPLRPVTPGTFSEATYSKASTLLGGQPLRSGDEIGGFWLGSTIVLVFEAPEDFEFEIERGQKVKMGQALGDVKSRKREMEVIKEKKEE